MPVGYRKELLLAYVFSYFLMTSMFSALHFVAFLYGSVFHDSVGMDAVLPLWAAMPVRGFERIGQMFYSLRLKSFFL